MEVEFADKRLALVDSRDWQQAKLPLGVVKSIRRKLVVLRAAPDERTLRNWKSLHYKKLEGQRSEEHSIRLNDQWRLVFRLKTVGNSQRIIDLSIEDYHP